MINEKRKISWKIKFDKRNIVRFVFFCIFAFFAIALLIQALVYVILGIFSANNKFLIAFPILCVIIDFFIGRKMILHSQIED